MTHMTLQAVRQIIANDAALAAQPQGAQAADISQSAPTSAPADADQQSVKPAAANAGGQPVWIVNDDRGEHVMMCLQEPTTEAMEYLAAKIERNVTVLPFVLYPADRTPAADAGGQDAAVAAIEFALEDEDGLDFLSYWNEGEFDVIRRNWESVPEAVFIGANPLHPATRAAATSAGEVDAARLGKLLELCTEAKSKFGRKGDLQAVTMTFKTSVRTSVGYRDQLRKLIDDMTPTFHASADRAAAKGAGTQQAMPNTLGTPEAPQTAAARDALAEIERLDRAAQIDGGQKGGAV